MYHVCSNFHMEVVLKKLTLRDFENNTFESKAGIWHKLAITQTKKYPDVSCS